MPSPTPPSPSTEDSDLDRESIKEAIAELEIIQRKIDNIGLFKFNVKAWTVTLILAGLVGGKWANWGWGGILCLLVIPLVLWNYERHLFHQGESLGKRARDVESFIAQRQAAIGLRRKFRKIGRIPGLASWVLQGNLAKKTEPTDSRKRRAILFFNKFAESIVYLSLIGVIATFSIGAAINPPRDRLSDSLDKISANIADLLVSKSNTATDRKPAKEDIRKEASMLLKYPPETKYKSRREPHPR